MGAIFDVALITLATWQTIVPPVHIGEVTMKIMSTIIALTAFAVVFVSTAHVGGALQKAQDTEVSRSDPGFVPSTGQISDGMR
jgi:hypothetical protein